RPLRWTVVVIGMLPADSFAVVMATGIVSVAARYNGYPVVSAVLAVLAGVGLLVLATLAAVRRATVGRAFADGPDPLTRTFGLFTFVAACSVLDARIGYASLVVVFTLGPVAVIAWFAIGAQLPGAFRAASPRTVRDRARGGWLLAAVATQSLALTAAQLARSGVAVTPLLVASLVWWLLGLLAYLLITGLIVSRLHATHLAPEALTPDLWVLMGALAIATVAGGTLALVAAGVPAFGWLPAALAPALLVVWLVAAAWIPLLVAIEIRRARRSRPRYERARWATVFPLGMFSTACFLLGEVLARNPTTGFSAALRVTSHAMFWVAAAAWCATAASMVLTWMAWIHHQ
ncbi:MAG: tellurite resistance/C4-dicarboxylate transporter family protein, partial [Pseudonocardia sp.]|nr:tellurite resistance/C4-dicarboxylate transporter family protein [Pseudonocardia sp.]